ncbi:MAG: flavodoxin family protein [Synergistaceae bacterium]|nr:flavodoxin family protein [Synergistaceae bacterium]
MKALFLNGSPRKNFNTAQLLKKAMEGAKAAGAEVELINLFDYEFTGCKSCFACKIKNSKTNGICAIHDKIRPVIEKAQEADVLVVGSPVYFGYPTGQVRNLIERLLFPLDTYLIDEQEQRVKVPHKPVQTALIYTMNCPEDLSHKFNYDILLGFTGEEMERLYGYNEILYCYETYQFTDYRKYDMNLFSEEQRRERKEKQFPVDLQKAYELGGRLVNRTKETKE